MRRALELGINWIDTAAVYGLGHSEEVVGRLLRELHPRERPLVFTTCGLVWDERHPMAEARRVLKPESIRKEAEASLRRLGIEPLDLYQFHWPDETGTTVEHSWEAMVRLVEQGKVRAAGVSNFDLGLLARCEEIRHADSLQPPFSLIRRDVAEREIPWCAEHRTGVLAYSPMQDRKSTRLNSSHVKISYAVFCLKKKKNKITALLQNNHTAERHQHNSLSGKHEIPRLHALS